MTTLCIDELSRSLKRRWGWASTATHVPIEADCPLLMHCPTERAAGPGKRSRVAVPKWLKPKRGYDGPPGIAGLHGKTSPSMG